MRNLGALSIAILLTALISGLVGLHLANRAYDRGDYAFALQVYEPLAILGIGSYRTRVGRMYLTGRGVSTDYSAAAKWFQEPADEGDPTAQFLLGLVYLTDTKGFGDRESAFNWFLKSASQGHKTAQEIVAISYAAGDGVAEDKVQALKWAIVAMGGELPRDFKEDMPELFSEGVSPAQIAEAQRLAREWIAERREEL